MVCPFPAAYSLKVRFSSGRIATTTKAIFSVLMGEPIPLITYKAQSFAHKLFGFAQVARMAGKKKGQGNVSDDEIVLSLLWAYPRQLTFKELGDSLGVSMERHAHWKKRLDILQKQGLIDAWARPAKKKPKRTFFIGKPQLQALVVKYGGQLEKIASDYPQFSVLTMVAPPKILKEIALSEFSLLCTQAFKKKTYSKPGELIRVPAVQVPYAIYSLLGTAYVLYWMEKNTAGFPEILAFGKTKMGKISPYPAIYEALKKTHPQEYAAFKDLCDKWG